MSAHKFDVLVAKCGKTIGLKGDIKLVIYTDFLEIFKKENLFKCGDSILTLESFNKHNSSVRFAEITDISSAKKLNSLNLYTTKEATKEHCKLKRDEFFWFDIIGANVVDGEMLIGVVSDIERIANTDYLVISVDSRICESKNIKAKKFLLPYIKRYVLDFDLAKKCVNVVDSIGILENS